MILFALVGNLDSLSNRSSPGSSVVEHLHGKQVAIGSIPILGKKQLNPNGGHNGKRKISEKQAAR